jgi:hypothetical protein
MPAQPLHSVRGLCKSPAKRGFLFQEELRTLQFDAGMEHFIKVRSPEEPSKKPRSTDTGEDADPLVLAVPR